jgi:hypothetical protein
MTIWGGLKTPQVFFFFFFFGHLRVNKPPHGLGDNLATFHLAKGSNSTTLSKKKKKKKKSHLEVAKPSHGLATPKYA